MNQYSLSFTYTDLDVGNFQPLDNFPFWVGTEALHSNFPKLFPAITLKSLISSCLAERKKKYIPHWCIVAS